MEKQMLFAIIGVGGVLVLGILVIAGLLVRRLIQQLDRGA